MVHPALSRQRGRDDSTRGPGETQWPNSYRRPCGAASVCAVRARSTKVQVRVGDFDRDRQADSACGRCLGIDVDAPPLAVEAHGAVDEREQGVVATDADVAAGVELGAALSDDDTPGGNKLAAVHLHAEALGVRF